MLAAAHADGAVKSDQMQEEPNRIEQKMVERSNTNSNDNRDYTSDTLCPFALCWFKKDFLL